MKIDSESPLLTKREGEFLRLIALKLREHADQRWHDLPVGHQESVDEVFGERKG